MKEIIFSAATILLCVANTHAQNALSIPATVTGAAINLNVQSGTRNFYPGFTTPTYGVNGVWMGPTIVVNKGDSITINVTNNLPVKTTMHWHGLHVAAHNDGGPHQSINPGATWSPTFKVLNRAGTYWYHPHGAGQTDPQVSKGIAGFFIVHDAEELAFNIPHTYGVDDIPVAIQTKAFDELKQIAIATNMDTALFVNGTLDAYHNTPAQVVRLRLLNGSSLRSYYLGLSDGQNMHQIATDGGLLDTTRTVNKLLLSPGERAEVLVDMTGRAGDTVYLRSYASLLPKGVYGADTLGVGVDSVVDYGANFRNGADFNVLQLRIVAPTTSPVTTIVTTLTSMGAINPAAATNTRAMVLDTFRMLPMDVPNRAAGPFAINNKSFDMDSINEVVYLNTTEVWTLKNNTLVAHPFHIHDVQFNVIEEHGIPVRPEMRGWKDVVLVMPMDSMKFVTHFADFADDMTPYMYHCHLLHHEDDGMMGSFLVVDSTKLTAPNFAIPTQTSLIVYPNPSNGWVTLQYADAIKQPELVTITDITGRQWFKARGNHQKWQISTSAWPRGMYIATVSNAQEVATVRFVVE